MFRAQGLVFLLFLCPQFSQATVAEFSEGFYDYSKSDDPQMDDKYWWLYRLQIPQKQRLEYPRLSERSFEVHLKDSLKFFPHPNDLIYSKLPPKVPHSIRGTITYAGVYPAKYRYDINVDENSHLTFRVKVHFKTSNPKKWRIIEGKILQAQRLWNLSRPDIKLNYSFEFIAEQNPDNAHFSVNLKDKFTRGPYFQNWSTAWSYKVVAHELGHMMGLGDEYRTITGKMDCLKASIMCSSKYGAITYQHHYHVLRRTLKGWL